VRLTGPLLILSCTRGGSTLADSLFLTAATYIFAFLIYTAVGVLGYLRFGPAVQNDILLSYQNQLSKKLWWVTPALVGAIITALVTFSTDLYEATATGMAFSPIRRCFKTRPRLVVFEVVSCLGVACVLTSEDAITVSLQLCGLVEAVCGVIPGLLLIARARGWSSTRKTRKTSDSSEGEEEEGDGRPIWIRKNAFRLQVLGAVLVVGNVVLSALIFGLLVFRFVAGLEGVLRAMDRESHYNSDDFETDPQALRDKVKRDLELDSL